MVVLLIRMHRMHSGSVFATKCYSDYLIKNNEIGDTYGTDGKEERYIQSLVGKQNGKR
jgi:hypothetical protein